MIAFTRGVRLIPIVLFAASSLLVLKTAGLLGGTGYAVGGLRGAQAQDGAAATGPAAEAKRSWAQEMFGYPEVTGSVGGAKPGNGQAVNGQAGGADSAKAGGQPAAPPAVAAKPRDGTPVPLDDRPSLSPGERAVLERLQERRQELEARARELDIREGLLKTAEQRIEIRIGELKVLEGQVNAALQKKDEAEAARFKGLITMYESMKAKDAARIFDRLELKVLLEVATQINPRRMSDILAQMSAEAAERLTVELANRAGGNGHAAPSAAELPKIEGRPRT